MAKEENGGDRRMGIKVDVEIGKERKIKKHREMKSRKSNSHTCKNIQYFISIRGSGQ